MGNEKLVKALEIARNGLRWYQDRYPSEVNGCDDEAMATIDAALRAHAAEAAQHPESTCEECGGANVTWFAPSPIWNEVVRNPLGRDLMLCPVCFNKRAAKAGYTRHAWSIHPEFYAYAASMAEKVEVVQPQPTEDARTPDSIDVSYEVWQHDEMVASCSGPEPQALTEAKHYASQYAQDGPVSVFRVSRVRINPVREPDCDHDA